MSKTDILGGLAFVGVIVAGFTWLHLALEKQNCHKAHARVEAFYECSEREDCTMNFYMIQAAYEADKRVHTQSCLEVLLDD